MKIFASVLFLMSSPFLMSQSRIGGDLNTQLNTINFTAHYQRVIKGPFLFTTGIGAGLYGHGKNVGDENQIVNGFGFGNAFPRLPKRFSSDRPDYLLRATEVKSSGYCAFVGIGAFKEFANLHGVRMNLNHRFSIIHSKVTAYYRDFNLQETISTPATIWHAVGAVSLEFYHTMRMSGRNTFYWGFKLPYYYSMDKTRFDPKVNGEVLHQFQPELSVGFTHSIGTCD